MKRLTLQEAEKKVAQGGYTFEDSIGRLLEPILKELKQPRSRNRIYPPECVLYCELASIISGEDCLSSAVVRNNQDRIQRGLLPASTNTGPYSDARKRVCQELFSKTSVALVKDSQKKVRKDELWGEYHPKAIDGTTLTTDDTAENQKAFPQHKNQSPGAGFPLIRGVLVQDLLTGMVQDFAYGPYKGKETGEMALARQLLPGLNRLDLLLGDCYFPSYFLLCDLLQKGVHGVFPMHAARGVDFRRGSRLNTLDHIVDWTKPVKPDWMTQEAYEAYPSQMRLREVDISKEVSHVKKNREPFVIVTTLLDDKAFPKSKLAKFYKNRWRVEVAIRDLKSTFHMEHIKAHTPEMLEKVIWAHILAYNVLRWHMLNASEIFEVPLEHMSVKISARILNESSHLIKSENNKKKEKLYF